MLKPEQEMDKARRPMATRALASAAALATLVEGSLFALPADLRFVVAGGLVALVWTKLPNRTGDRLVIGFGTIGLAIAIVDLVRHHDFNLGLSVAWMSSAAALLYALTIASVCFRPTSPR